MCSLKIRKDQRYKVIKKLFDVTISTSYSNKRAKNRSEATRKTLIKKVFIRIEFVS